MRLANFIAPFYPFIDRGVVPDPRMNGSDDFISLLRARAHRSGNRVLRRFSQGPAKNRISFPSMTEVCGKARETHFRRILTHILDFFPQT